MERRGWAGPDRAPERRGGSGLDQTGARGLLRPPPDPPTCSFTDPAVSMDLLRAVLQPSINEEIRGVFNKYMKVRAAGTGPAAPSHGGLRRARPASRPPARLPRLAHGVRVQRGSQARVPAPALPSRSGSNPLLPPPL